MREGMSAWTPLLVTGMFLLGLLAGCASQETAQTSAVNVCRHLAGDAYAQCYAQAYNASLDRQTSTWNTLLFDPRGDEVNIYN